MNDFRVLGNSLPIIRRYFNTDKVKDSAVDRGKAMTIIYFQIMTCPRCNRQFSCLDYASYNTFGAKFYTDGFVEGPISVDVSRLLMCPHCINIFWRQDIPARDYDPTKRTYLEARNDGIAKLINLNIVRNRDGELVVINHDGEIAVLEECGRDREKYHLIYGAKLWIEDGKRVKSGDILAEWDSYTVPILAEVAGKARYGDLVEDISLQEQLDVVTGLSRKVVVESKAAELRPRISIKDAFGRTAKVPGTTALARYHIPIGAYINVADGQDVYAGDVIADIPRETTKTKNITGGLSRIGEPFKTIPNIPSALTVRINSEIMHKALWRNIKEEIYIRIRVWWLFNEPYRTHTSLPFDFPPDQRANHERLLQLLDSKEPDDAMTKAEILRELGRFEECIMELNRPFEGKYLKAVQIIKALAEKRERRVSEIR